MYKHLVTIALAVWVIFFAVTLGIAWELKGRPAYMYNRLPPGYDLPNS